MKGLLSGQGGALRSSRMSEDISHTSVNSSTLQWYAIFTMPRHEKSVDGYFDFQRIVHFLPVYERVNTWRNRQTVRVKTPLFPRYLFARFERQSSGRVLKTPGVLRIVGTEVGPIPVPNAEIEFLRTSIAENTVEPFPHFAIGRQVRIRTGSMAGVEGTLVRKENRNRFVLTLSLIQQSVSIDVDASNLELL
jgi:transcription antitermination factor NusG